MLDHLTAVVTLILGLSIATERLVELAKGAIEGIARKPTGFISGKSDNVRDETVRRAFNHILAIGCGLITAFLAQPIIPKEVLPVEVGAGAVFGLGLLASGGSGFWNGVLGYFSAIKNKGAAGTLPAGENEEEANHGI